MKLVLTCSHSRLGRKTEKSKLVYKTLRESQRSRESSLPPKLPVDRGQRSLQPGDQVAGVLKAIRMRHRHASVNGLLDGGPAGSWTLSLSFYGYLQRDFFFWGGEEAHALPRWERQKRNMRYNDDRATGDRTQRLQPVHKQPICCTPPLRSVEDTW